MFGFLETLEKAAGWKRLYKEPKRTLGLAGAHRKTPIWETVILILLTLAAAIQSVCFLTGLILVAFIYLSAEYLIWVREKIKTKRQTKSVKKAMDEHRKRTAEIMEERMNN
jgi:hypothetical protein